MIKEIFIKTYLLIFLIPFGSTVIAQTILPLNHTFSKELETYLYQKENWTHTSSKPFIKGFINDSGFERWKPKERKSNLLTHILNTDNVTIKEEDVNIRMNVLMNFRLEQDQATNRYSTNTRGIKIEGELGKKISFFTSYLENQSFFNPYIKNFVDLRPEFRADGTLISGTGVVPGMGRTKPFKTSGYDYSMASGMLSYSVNDNINIQFGNHKNFIGDGYRTFFLSDNAFNYPHLKYILQSKNHKWQYTGIHAQLTDLRRLPNTTTVEAPFAKKNMVVHYLSYKPWKNFTLGLFDNMILEKSDINGKPVSKSFWVYNPIPTINFLSRTSNYNSNGLLFNYSPFNFMCFYSQIYSNNIVTTIKPFTKLAYQLGGKFNFAFDNHKIWIQLEMNKNDRLNQINVNTLNSHYSQSLNQVVSYLKSEVLTKVIYNWKRIELEAFYSEANFGITNNSRVLFKSNVSYLLNPSSGLKLSIGTMTYNAPHGKNLKLFNISMSTNFENFYFDF